MTAEFEAKPVSSAKAEVEKTLHCYPNHFGCGCDVPKSVYNASAMLCNECAHAVGQKFSLAYDAVNYALIQSVLSYYEGNKSQPGKVPWLKPHSYRTKVRVLAFAAGCLGVKMLTVEEREWAMRVREACPDLYKVIPGDPIQEAANRISDEMARREQMVGGW